MEGPCVPGKLSRVSKRNREYAGAIREILHPQNHDFSGLDEGGGDLSLFQSQFADRIRGDHRSDLLAAIDSLIWAMMPSTLMSTMRPIN